MKLQKYISNRFPKGIEEIDYVDVFVNEKFVGMHTASLALKGKYLALDPVNKRKKASYCFPMDTVIEVNNGFVRFDYCGAKFDLTLFRGEVETETKCTWCNKTGFECECKQIGKTV